MPTYFKVQWSEILKAESNLKNSRTIMEGEIMNFEATVKERQRLELKLKEEIAEIDRLTAARERALEKIDENKKQERIAQLGFKRDIMQTSLAIKDKELEIDQLHLQKLQLARNEAKTQSEIDKLDEQIAEQQEKIDNAEKEITAKRSLLRYRKRLNGFDKRPIHLPTLTTYKDPEARKTLVSDIIHHFFMNGLKSV
ncbi:MAG: hypothetical protein Q8O99_05155 [bacterium]|nr:hypothetical protein [bacterium]